MSAPSLSTDEQAFKELHGRGMSKKSEVYTFPVDQEERNRLSMQHQVWRLCEGDLYPKQTADIVAKILTMKDGRQPSIFDIGSGSGHWAVEMASTFPDALVIGLDLSESKPEFIPPNCSFVAADITHELPEYVEKFDLVHCRSVANHVADPVALLETAEKCLKPGGLCIFEDGSFIIHNEQKGPMPPAEEGTDNQGRSWLARWMLEMRIRMTRNMQDQLISPADELLRFMQDNGHFEQLAEKAYFAPINWDGDGIENGHEIGQLMAVNVKRIIESGRPLFLATGLTNDDADRWERNIEAEVDGPTIRMYWRWNAAWGLKSGGNQA